MNNSLNIMLITQTRVKPNANQAFEHMLKKMSSAIIKFDGYVSQEIHKPSPPLQLDWIVIDYFTSIEAAKAWLQSTERQNILKEVLSSLLSINNTYIMQPGKHDQSTISAIITSKINPHFEQKFLDWQLRIAPIQSKFPGFIGYKLEKHRTKSDESWIAIVTFDTEEHLDAWLKSPERQKMLAELYTYAGDSQIEKISTGFDFWFNKTSSRAIWKENMLVLLTLYPVVFLLSYVQNFVMNFGIPFWLSLFFSNLMSTVILSSLTVPWLTYRFKWWLNPPQKYQKKYTLLGIVIVVILYMITLGVNWLLSTIN